MKESESKSPGKVYEDHCWIWEEISDVDVLKNRKWEQGKLSYTRSKEMHSLAKI